MFWLVHPVNEDIIHLTEGPFQALKYLGHGALEDLWGGTDTEWESVETKTSKRLRGVLIWHPKEYAKNY